LSQKEYPDHPHWQSNSKEALEQARYFVRQKAGTPNKEFYITYYYLQVFHNLFDIETKVLAIRDLAQMQILNGVMLAALADDPSEDVRAEAALALAKYNDESFILARSGIT
jgi:hypothetical protein